MRLLDLTEPEETVGSLWHTLVTSMADTHTFPDEAVKLSEVRTSLSFLLHALGGAHSIELSAAPATGISHRTDVKHQLRTGFEQLHVASFNGENLRLPPVIDCFNDRTLNRAAYFWLAAMAALAARDEFPELDDEAMQEKAIQQKAVSADFDYQQICLNGVVAERVYTECPGLREAYRDMCLQTLVRRPKHDLPADEEKIEKAVHRQLSGHRPDPVKSTQFRGYHSYDPVPIWLRFLPLGLGSKPAAPEVDEKPAIAAPLTERKLGERRNLDQTDRPDGFIFHRFESILSWVESLNINRHVDDDDNDNAKKSSRGSGPYHPDPAQQTYSVQTTPASGPVTRRRRA